MLDASDPHMDGLAWVEQGHLAIGESDKEVTSGTTPEGLVLELRWGPDLLTVLAGLLSRLHDIEQQGYPTAYSTPFPSS